MTQIASDLDEIYRSVQQSWRLQNSNILVTGAGGFLGFYFCEFFKKYFVELEINKLALIDVVNLEEKRGWEPIPGKIEIIKHDLSDLQQLPLDIAEFNIIINLASFASPVAYRANPIGTLEGSVLSVWNLLKSYAETKNGDGCFQIFSSSEIYGDPPAEQSPTSEDYWGNVSCLGPRACYDESKRFIETLGYAFAKQAGMNVSIIRPFNNFGPGMSLDDGRMVSDVMRSMVNMEDLNIYSDGKPTRSFCYVTDAIIGYLLALNKKGFSVYNVGNDHEELSVNEFVSICQAVYKSKYQRPLKVHYKKSADPEFLINNPNRRFPDLSKARAELNYEPKVSAQEGIKRWLEFESESSQRNSVLR